MHSSFNLTLKSNRMWCAIVKWGTGLTMCLSATAWSLQLQSTFPLYLIHCISSVHTLTSVIEMWLLLQKCQVLLLLFNISVMFTSIPHTLFFLNDYFWTRNSLCNSLKFPVREEVSAQRGENWICWWNTYLGGMLRPWHRCHGLGIPPVWVIPFDYLRMRENSGPLSM